MRFNLPQPTQQNLVIIRWKGAARPATASRSTHSARSIPHPAARGRAKSAGQRCSSPRIASPTAPTARQLLCSDDPQRQAILASAQHPRHIARKPLLCPSQKAFALLLLRRRPGRRHRRDPCQIEAHRQRLRLQRRAHLLRDLSRVQRGYLSASLLSAYRWLLQASCIAIAPTPCTTFYTEPR